MVVLLLDDERSFIDGRDAVVARTNEEAVEFTDDLTELDELWLDFVLRYGDTTDYLWHLKDRKKAGNPLNLGTVYIHTSSYMAVGLLKRMLVEDLDVDEENIKVVNYRDYMFNE